MRAQRYNNLRGNTPSGSSPGSVANSMCTGLAGSVTTPSSKKARAKSSPVRGFHGLAAHNPQAYNQNDGGVPAGRAPVRNGICSAFLMKASQQITVTERALLVGVAWKRAPRFPGQPAGAPERESLLELVELARSAGADIAGTVFQLRDKADPATLIGRGKLEEITAEANVRKAPLIIFDSNLSPVQQRNIEEVTERRVIDRTQ